MPPQYANVLKHLTNLPNKAEAQPELLEFPKILLDRWSKEKTKKQPTKKKPTKESRKK